VQGTLKTTIAAGLTVGQAQENMIGNTKQERQKQSATKWTTLTTNWQGKTTKHPTTLLQCN
jgi:hypothetical protein